jgi:hypothetical protein
LTFEFSSLLFDLTAFGGFLLFEHFGVPDGFPLGELLRGEVLRAELISYEIRKLTSSQFCWIATL